MQKRIAFAAGPVITAHFRLPVLPTGRLSPTGGAAAVKANDDRESEGGGACSRAAAVGMLEMAR
jgi:hypothetical protein